LIAIKNIMFFHFCRIHNLLILRLSKIEQVMFFLTHLVFDVK
jgi:hypothetical protein